MGYIFLYMMLCPLASCACASDSSALLQACFALKCYSRWMPVSTGDIFHYRAFVSGSRGSKVYTLRIPRIACEGNRVWLYILYCRHICTQNIHININLWFFKPTCCHVLLIYAYWFFIHINISLHSTPVLRTSPARDPSKSLLLHSVAAPREPRAFRPS